MTLSPEARAQVFAGFDRAGPAGLGLAVSGGGDSMALLALAASWVQDGQNRRVAAVTINHGLRPEAAAEAQRVAALCGEIGVSHATLHWDGWDGRGNLQDRARDARSTLIADWAQEQGLGAVATGHTHDDQAETVLMRLARGSGVDGLAGMAPEIRRAGVLWLRPLLDLSRASLRDFLAAEGLPWVEDPSNEDPGFDRVKARQALAMLAPLGITARGLVDTAARMARARDALAAMAGDLGERALRMDRGDILLDWTALACAPEDIRLRLVASALMWVSGAHYRPRAAALEGVIEALETRRTTVLGGCQLSAEGSWRRVTRELAAVSGTVCALDQAWDNRWLLRGPSGRGGEIRALGDAGIRACPDWRESGMPRVSLVASPSVWEGERLIAAPLAGFGRDWSAELVPARAMLPTQHV